MLRITMMNLEIEKGQSYLYLQKRGQLRKDIDVHRVWKPDAKYYRWTFRGMLANGLQFRSIALMGT